MEAHEILPQLQWPRVGELRRTHHLLDGDSAHDDVREDGELGVHFVKQLRRFLGCRVMRDDRARELVRTQLLGGGGANLVNEEVCAHRVLDEIGRVARVAREHH